MKPFITLWIKRVYNCFYFLLAILVLASFACVSTPAQKNSTNNFSPEANVINDNDIEPVAETPQVFDRVVAKAFSENQPDIKAPEPIFVEKQNKPPQVTNDITVLSTQTVPVYGSVILPEPAPFVQLKPATSEATATKVQAPQKPEQPKTEQSKIEQPKTEQSKIEQPKTEQSKTEQSKIEQSKIEQSKTEQSKIEQSKTEQSKIEQPAKKESAQSLANKETNPGSSSKPVLAPAPSPTTSALITDFSAKKPIVYEEKSAVKGERLELRLPGAGWLYLGDEEGKDGIRYETRRFENEEAVFSLKPERNGEYLLRFQRQNPITSTNETKLIKINVKPEADLAESKQSKVTEKLSSSAEPIKDSPKPTAAQNTEIKATPTNPALAAEQQKTEQQKTEQQKTEQQNSAILNDKQSIPSPLLDLTGPSELLAYAKNELEAKRILSAVSALERYFSLYPYGSDEAYYLYGLALEQDTPYMDIKKSHEAYKKVRDEYPRSPYWTKANDRIVFLEKFYYGLR